MSLSILPIIPARSFTPLNCKLERTWASHGCRERSETIGGRENCPNIECGIGGHIAPDGPEWAREHRKNRAEGGEGKEASAFPDFLNRVQGKSNVGPLLDENLHLRRLMNLFSHKHQGPGRNGHSINLTALKIVK